MSWEQLLEWIQNNLAIAIIIAAVFVLLIITLIALAVRASHKKKRAEEEAAVQAEEPFDAGSVPPAAENAEEENPADVPAVPETAAAPADEAVPAETPEETHAEPAPAAPVSDEVSGQPAASQPESVPEQPVIPAGNEPHEEAADSENEEIFDGVEVVSRRRAPAKKKDTPKKTGKWTIEIKRAGEYIAKLSAANGEVMLSSEIYSTEAGARNGIATIIKCIESGRFLIYQDKAKNFYYKLKTSTNRLLCVGEIYTTRDQCEKAVESVKRIAASSPVSDELVEGMKYVDYTPVKVDSYDVKKGARGKWKVETTEEGKYCARLYASNGQLMLATEEVSMRRSALSAIESVKKNSAQGNFIIDRDKFGRYYYKLRNAQKSVICIGETYDSLDSCISALESVRRFAATATVPSELQ